MPLHCHMEPVLVHPSSACMGHPGREEECHAAEPETRHKGKLRRLW